MPNILRTTMKNVSTFKFTHAVSGLTMTEGYMYMIQHTVGVLLLDIQYNSDGSKADKEITEDDEGVLIYNAKKIRVRKFVETGDVFLPGDKVYWSGAQGDKVHPHHRSADYWVGICVWPASATDAYVIIDLKGDKASLTEPL